MIILDGKSFAQEIREKVKEKSEKFCETHAKPCLACIIVEGNKASEVYVASKQKACEACGMTSVVVRLPEDVSQDSLESEIVKLNQNPSVNGILLQLPLPAHFDEDAAINKICPKKDVDCLTYENLGKLFAGKSKFAPCTAQGIIKLLKTYKIEMAGKHAVVIGRSLLVGKSVACLLEQNNATVTLCHSKTQSLQEITKQADILIVAIGKSKYITKEYVKDGAVVVDVGINRVDGKLYGDVDFENVKEKCSYITPVPGGVGPLTVACLMENTLFLAGRDQRDCAKTK